MKKLIVISMLLASLTFARTCPNRIRMDPADVPIEYDPNQAVGGLLVGCVFTAYIGEQWVHDCGPLSCDPEELPLIWTLAGPPGAMIDPNGVISWIPDATGVAYLVVTVTDQVPDDCDPNDGPYSDTGTMLLNVYRRNLPPVLDGCGG